MTHCHGKIALGLAALLAGLGAHASPTAQEILAASDAVRNPERAFGVTTSLVEYRAGKQTDASTLVVYSRADRQSGQFRNLIRFVAPARDANKLMLKSGNDLWFYDPSSKSSIRISPQQRLLGQAANGDIVTVNLAGDYSATLEKEEDIQDGEKQTRHCYKLALAASAPDVTYHRIEIWIDTANSRPHKARFYADGGRLLKTAYYRHYQKQLGQERPSETVIIDGIDASWVTVLRMSDYKFQDVPDVWLQRDYLPRFRADQ